MLADVGETRLHRGPILPERGVTEPILTTERLAFRPFTPEDYAVFADLHADPDVQRFIGGLWDAETLRGRFDSYIKDHAANGFAKWRMDEIGGGFVGAAGLSLDAKTGRADLGYSFVRSAWGRGLASEAARALTDWLFARTGVQVMTACAAVDHAASRRILEKLGMAPDGEGDRHGVRCAFYRLARPAQPLEVRA
jgi:ribosomal-protein-alanine N-acetyltransferase